MSELGNMELLGNLQHTGDQFSVDSNSQSHSIRKTQPDKTLERLLDMVSPGSPGEADAHAGQV